MNELWSEVILANELIQDVAAEASAVVTAYCAVGSRACVLVRYEHTR
jgi:hypothetical protein